MRRNVPTRNFGPFELSTPIGKGAMGEVWLARYTPEDDREVAIKLLTSAGQRAEALAGFQREVQAIARLRHPNVTTILDYGAVRRGGKDVPWYAMELARCSLRQVMGSMAWPQLRSALLQVLSALAHTHARRILHRDLKPENILVSHGPRAAIKVADYGLAIDLRRDTLMGDRRSIVGTPTYMPPEQFDALWRDYGPWTDLYALGCVAWEMVTGAPPFAGRHVLALAAQHSTAALPTLEPIVPVPDGVEAWLSTLLAKAPADRYCRASDAAWALLALGDAPTADGDAPAADLDAAHRDTIDSEALIIVAALDTEDALTLLDPRPSALRAQSDREAVYVGRRLSPCPSSWRMPHDAWEPASLTGVGLNLYGLRELPFVDRDAARDAIWETFLRVQREQRAEVIVLEGVAGTGKSRLAAWMSQRAHAVGGAITLHATHSPQQGASDGLGYMMERHLRTSNLGVDRAHQRVHAIFKALGGTSVQASSLLAMLPSLEGAGVMHRSPAERFEALLDYLRPLSTGRPVILWLDDVHFSPDALSFAEHLLAVGAHAPSAITVLLTVRSDEEHPETRELLGDLYKNEQVTRFTLGALPETDHRALVTRMLSLTPALAERVARCTAANPLFAVQLVEDWVLSGELESSPEGFHLAAPTERLPESLHTLWLSRLERLAAGFEEMSDETRLALEVASALGVSVSEDEWVAACRVVNGQPPPGGLIDAMVRAHLAYPIEGGWAFTHGMLRESLRQSAIDHDRWPSHHQACAAALQRRDGQGPEHDVRIANHLLAAYALEDALEPLLRAARAFRWYDHAHTHRLLATYQRAAAAIPLPPSDIRHTYALELLASLYAEHFDLESARETAASALALAETHGHDLAKGWALRRLGHCHWLKGQKEEGRDLFERSLAIDEALDNAAGQIDALRGIVQMDLHQGRLEDAERRITLADALTEAASDDFEGAWFENQRALVHRNRGEYEAARALLRSATKTFRAMGVRARLANTINNLADLDRMEGHFEPAEEGFEEALALWESVGSRSAMNARFNLALVRVQRHRFSDAEAHLDSLLAFLETHPWGEFEAFVRCALLPCLVNRGDIGAFDANLDTARALIEKFSVVDPDIATAATIAAELLGRASSRASACWDVAASQWRGLGQLEKAAAARERASAR